MAEISAKVFEANWQRAQPLTQLVKTLGWEVSVVSGNNSKKGEMDKVNRTTGRQLFELLCAFDQHSQFEATAGSAGVGVLSEWAFIDGYLALRELLGRPQNVARLRLCKNRDEVLVRLRRKLGKAAILGGSPRSPAQVARSRGDTHV